MVVTKAIAVISQMNSEIMVNEIMIVANNFNIIDLEWGLLLKERASLVNAEEFQMAKGFVEVGSFRVMVVKVGT
jgi:hypothetical protein